MHWNFGRRQVYFSLHKEWVLLVVFLCLSIQALVDLGRQPVLVSFHPSGGFEVSSPGSRLSTLAAPSL